MLSKNNKQLMVEKQAAKKQRYGLRKLSIGVASVLLGMTFLGAGSISAAENENLETATTENQVKAVSDPLNEQTEITLMPQAEAEKQTDGQAYEEKAVTRTINLYKDGELVDTKVQIVNFHKILGTWYVKNDGVVGVKTGQFDAYDIPEQAGYTAQVNGVAVDKVDNMSVTADTPNQVVDVYYVANTKTYTEERVITRTINIWHDDELFDVIRQEEVFTREVTENLTTGEKTYGAWDEPTKMFDEVTLPQYEGYKHTEGTVQKRCIVNPNSKNIVNDIKYTSEKEISEETRTVERVINLYKDGEHTETVKQSVTFKREVIKNLVTDEIEYGEWIAEDGKDHWDEYKAKELENYELENGVVDKKKVTADTPSETVSINYKAKVETVTEEDTVKRVINIYQDGKKVDEVTQVVEFSREVKKNLVTGETEYGEWVAKDGKDNWDAFDAPEYENYTTDTVKIDNEVVKPGMADQEVSVNYTSKVETVTEYDTVKRVISTYQDGKKVDEVTQSVTFSREVKKNLVTGKTEWGEWVAKDGKDNWDAFDAPEYENYTTDTVKIDNKSVKPGMEDEEVSINYTSKVETTTEYDTVKRVISIYQDGKKVDEVTQVVEFSREVKKNLVTGETEYGEWIAKDGKDNWDAFDAPEYENYTTDTVKIDNEVVKPGMVDQEVSINYTAKIDTRIEERFVQRTIILHLPNGETKKVTQDVTFKREVRKNLVTGEEVYGAWGMEKITFPEYEVPKIENYTPTMDKVEATVVTPDTQSWTVDIYYEAAIETTTEYDTVKRVISIYQDGKKVDEVTQSVTFSREVKKNLATGEVTYGEWVAKDGKDIWEAFDAPEYENYTTDTVKIDNKTVKPEMEDEEAAIYYTSKVETKTEYDTVKRVISIYQDGKKVDEVTQSVTFSREVKKNLATGEVTYGEWVAKDGKDIWDAFDAPEYENYTTDTVKIDNEVVKPGMADQEVSINYTAKIDTRIEERFVQRTIILHLPNGETKKVTQDVTFKREVRKNLVTGEEVYGAWGMEKITFPEYEVPKIENYTPTMDKVEATVVTPDTQSWTVDIYYEAAIETTTEYDTVKRVISIYHDGKKVDEVTQSVTFSREVKKNLATGEVTYGEWVAKDGKDIWDAFDAPEYENYTTDTIKIDNKTVKPGMEDEEAAIYYTSKVETTTEYDTVKRVINIYHDGKKVNEVTQSVTFSREVKKNLATGEVTYGEWVAKDGKDIWEAFDAPEYENYTTDTVKIDNKSVKPGMEDEEAAIYYTSKVETTTEYDTVKRVISIYQDGKKVDEVTQSVTFSREVKKNLATGEVTYGEWVAKDGKDIWDAFDAPEYENYTTDTVKIDNKAVKPGMEDEEAAIYYTSKVETRIEYSTVKRVIGIYQDGKKVDEVTQSVTFKREVKKNLATGEETYGDWDRPEDIWEAFDAPEYENYTTDTVKIDNKTVKPEMEDEEAAIYYTSKVETTTEYDTVKRVISIYQDGKKVDEVTQSVTFSREVKKNLATGEV
ncbi:MAG: YSIRK-type signal peptide-containing protein, partial [Ligilactobacillus murinus]|nr:YSIRK-type signal peptide-containing protein [Ligilactobacillus murinus]